MIEIIRGNNTQNHDFFELLRMLYPCYEEEGKLTLSLEKIALLTNGEKKEEFPWKGDDTLLKKMLVEDSALPGKIDTPWGSLVGIRPTKLVMKLLEEVGDSRTEEILRDEYGISSYGVKILIKVSKREMKLIKDISKASYSVYVHIPFCPTRCGYCSFPTIKTSERRWMREYVETLLEEIGSYKNKVHKEPVSIYFGGGTPSAIDHGDLLRLVDKVNDVFGKSREFTVECGRPDTITKSLLRGLKEYGVDRISINPQTMHDETLKVLGRYHSVSACLQAYEAAHGDFTINMDLILGLPGETPNLFMDSLRMVADLHPENITVHSLSMKNGSWFRQNREVSSFRPKEVLRTHRMGEEFLKEKGYDPYYMYRQKRTVGNGFNVGYTIPGRDSLYNVLMMEERQSILGFGMSSTTKFYYPETDCIEKVYQYKNIRDYIQKWSRKQEKKEVFLKDFLF